MKKPRAASALLPALVRAVLDACDDEIALFDQAGRVLYLNTRARSAQASGGSSPPRDAELRANLLARSGQSVPLHADGVTLGDMVLVRGDDHRPWAHREFDVIREALARSGGKRGPTARQLGISRTTLWRRLRRRFQGSGE